MSKADIKIIQKGILGRLGRVNLNYAGIEENYIDSIQVDSLNIYKDLEKGVPNVPSTEEYKESETPVPPYWQRPDGTCRVCNNTESWLSIYGVIVCGRCHPPASEALVTQCGHVRDNKNRRIKKCKIKSPPQLSWFPLR